MMNYITNILMRILKSHPLLKLVNSYIIDSPQPSNLSYLWNFGSLLAFCLIIQIITGVTLAMHYTPSVLEAFDSVEHIMRDVNNGWLIRYIHSNTASAFFFIVYLHIGRGLYYGSYRGPRTLVWTIGTVIFILMMATAFLGYVLPYGQMSLWGATVITNLMSAIPWVGQDIVQFIWGGFSVNNATLNRFFALHFVLPFVLAALALMHLITLHDSAGSGNPLGISSNCDRLPFSPYFIFKDLVTIFIFIIVLSIFVFFIPNALGDSENYVVANPMQTPPAIVPEWYLLPFYAILRSIPNKLLGVIAMFSAILALLVMPYTDMSKLRGIAFRPFSKIAFYIFIANFWILMQLGAKHVESPFIEFGQISTALYFSHFLIIVPLITTIENSLMDLTTQRNSPKELIRSDLDKLIQSKSALLNIAPNIPDSGTGGGPQGSPGRGPEESSKKSPEGGGNRLKYIKIFFISIITICLRYFYYICADPMAYIETLTIFMLNGLGLYFVISLIRTFLTLYLDNKLNRENWCIMFKSNFTLKKMSLPSIFMLLKGSYLLEMPFLDNLLGKIKHYYVSLFSSSDILKSNLTDRQIAKIEGSTDAYIELMLGVTHWIGKDGEVINKNIHDWKEGIVICHGHVKHCEKEVIIHKNQKITKDLLDYVYNYNEKYRIRLQNLLNDKTLPCINWINMPDTNWKDLPDLHKIYTSKNTLELVNIFAEFRKD